MARRVDRGWNNGTRSTYTGLFPPYWTNQDREAVTDGVQQLEQMADTLDLSAPWEAAEAAQWDDRTLDDWLAENISSDRARDLIRRGVVGVFGSGPGKLSLLAALFVINSAQDLIRQISSKRYRPAFRWWGAAAFH